MKKIPDEYRPVAGTIEMIFDFVNHGVYPGGFLEAVLSNDLKESFGRADENNFENMGLIVRFCYNHIPMACWGNPEKFKAWMDFKQAQRNMEKIANEPTN